MISAAEASCFHFLNINVGMEYGVDKHVLVIADGCDFVPNVFFELKLLNWKNDSLLGLQNIEKSF